VAGRLLGAPARPGGVWGLSGLLEQPMATSSTCWALLLLPVVPAPLARVAVSMAAAATAALVAAVSATGVAAGVCTPAAPPKPAASCCTPAEGRPSLSTPWLPAAAAAAAVGMLPPTWPPPPTELPVADTSAGRPAPAAVGVGQEEGAPR
jgi:hypothetical protein